MGLQTTARGPNPTREAISSGRKTHFANNEKMIYLQKMCSFGVTQFFRNQSRYLRCPALKLLCNSLRGPLPKN